MSKVQKTISNWLLSLWYLGALSPSFFAAVIIFYVQPRFGLPEYKWLYLVLLGGFSACACSAALMPFSAAKRIGFVFLGALIMAIQLAAIMIYAASHFPEPA